MKTQLRKLNRLIKIDCLNPDNFYVIEFWKNEINFQGHFDNELILKLTKLFGKGDRKWNKGFIKFKKNNVRILIDIKKRK